jgi:hypothetical protein
VDESDLRAIAWADDLPEVCAVSLAAIGDREAGREVLTFNTVDVVLDCDEGTLVIEDILDANTPALEMSIELFTDLATRLTEPQHVADAAARRAQSRAEQRVWPMPPGTE